MNRGAYASVLAEMRAVERMLEETSEEDVIDRASLAGRLATLEAELAEVEAEPERARVRLTFRGRPVVGGHGIFAEFGAKAVNGFAESVAAIAASLHAPLAATGPIPNRDQHQLVITSTATGSFGFELEEHPAEERDGESTVARALERTQALLRSTQASDDELADSVADVDRRALEKVRAFLELLADHDAVCTVQLGASAFGFQDVGEVRRSLARLTQENLHETTEELAGELLGVLPEARQFELRIAGSGQVIRGKIAPTVTGELHRHVQHLVRARVVATRVGSGRPRYVLTALDS